MFLKVPVGRSIKCAEPCKQIRLFAEYNKQQAYSKLKKNFILFNGNAITPRVYFTSYFKRLPFVKKMSEKRKGCKRCQKIKQEICCLPRKEFQRLKCLECCRKIAALKNTKKDSCAGDSESPSSSSIESKAQKQKEVAKAKKLQKQLAEKDKEIDSLQVSAAKYTVIMETLKESLKREKCSIDQEESSLKDEKSCLNEIRNSLCKEIEGMQGERRKVICQINALLTKYDFNKSDEQVRGLMQNLSCLQKKKKADDAPVCACLDSCLAAEKKKQEICDAMKEQSCEKKEKKCEKKVDECEEEKKREEARREKLRLEECKEKKRLEECREKEKKRLEECREKERKRQECEEKKREEACKEKLRQEACEAKKAKEKCEADCKAKCCAKKEKTCEEKCDDKFDEKKCKKEDKKSKKKDKCETKEEKCGCKS